MQSTHNTIGSNIAIKTHCHGYNVTYTQESHSLEWAIRDAELLLRSGKVKTYWWDAMMRARLYSILCWKEWRETTTFSSFCSHGVVMWRVIVLAVVQSALLAIGQVF